MSLIETTEPKMISYLDLYGFSQEEMEVTENARVTIKGQKTDVLFGLPDMDDHTVKKALWTMGLDTEEDYETLECNHKPLCLMGRAEKGVTIFGRAYCGIERQDEEWLAFKRKYKL